MPPPNAHHHSASSSNVDRAADSMARLSVSSGQRRPPRTIAELAEAAKSGTDDDSLPLKQYLRNAENARKAGRRLYDEDDLENAFIQLARAATIVLEKLPAHKDYRTLLNSTQRHNMGLHGQEILDQLATIKNTLLEQSEAYDRLPSSSTVYAPPLSQSSSRSPGSTASNAPHRNRPPQPSPPDPSESLTDNVRFGVDDGGRRSARYADEHVARSNSRSQLPAPVLDYAREEQRRRFEEKERYEQQQEEMKRRGEDILRRRRQEQDGIAQRQREAETAAQAARSAPPVPTVSVSAPVAVPAHTMPSPMPIPFLQLPLESPSRPQSGLRPSRTPLNRTKTTPPPVQPIEYPSLMSQHQIKQGYTPSASSMFVGPPPPGALQQPNPSQALYNNPLPMPAMPYGLHGAPSRSTPSAPPTRVQAPPAQQTQSSSNKGPPRLRRVDTPREVIDRFIAIAGINTKRNRETCGLLLGRDDGDRFYVTTLLIPKQHSTSDTCTMDEEELVLEFTETRSLVTLGWIHTHPTQSCFMSSVDLHTHSGFQRMLPESFAIVCAPKYNPSFGIFRLTDPPGLQIVLDCQAKEAFHPHPPAPIYTDADKNHVVLTDMPLEIVDIRN
ncbi:unnamed protein product [Peniophora sp. CBMAI 1063]|nr:unnamed protein product [Peniophora sp. CBMAI 1063]